MLHSPIVHLASSIGETEEGRRTEKEEGTSPGSSGDISPSSVNIGRVDVVRLGDSDSKKGGKNQASEREPFHVVSQRDG